MSAVLVQISIAFGMIMFFVSLGIGVSNDVPILAAIFRAFVALCVSSVAMTLFFKFFVSVIYRFVAEQVLMQSRLKASERVAATAAGARSGAAAAKNGNGTA